MSQRIIWCMGDQSKVIVRGHRVGVVQTTDTLKLHGLKLKRSFPDTVNMLITMVKFKITFCIISHNWSEGGQPRDS